MSEAIVLDLFESFKKGMEAYFALPELPRSLRPAHASVSSRIASSLRPFFPESVSVDIDVLGTDILIWNETGPLLALFWSSSYLAKNRKIRAISFHEKEKAPLTLAFSIFPDKERFLVYRIENGFIEYLHINKNTFSEEVLRRCTIDEGKKDSDQLLLPLRIKKKKITSSQDQ